MEVLSLIIYTKYFWDFDIWPLNRVWPLNGGPLDGGSTVCTQLTSNPLQAAGQNINTKTLIIT